jgi:hypothetical protein
LVSYSGRRPDADRIQGQKRSADVIGNAVGTMRIANIKPPTNTLLCFQISNRDTTSFPHDGTIGADGRDGHGSYTIDRAG